MTPNTSTVTCGGPRTTGWETRVLLLAVIKSTKITFKEDEDTEVVTSVSRRHCVTAYFNLFIFVAAAGRGLCT